MLAIKGIEIDVEKCKGATTLDATSFLEHLWRLTHKSMSVDEIASLVPITYIFNT